MPEFFRQAHEYDDLAAILRERAEQLQVTREGLDEIAGWDCGYAAKLLSPLPIKNLGRKSFSVALQALGLRLVISEDPEMIAKIGPRLPRRERPLSGIEPVVGSTPEIEELVQARLRRIMSDRGRRGAAVQRRRKKAQAARA